MQTDKVTYQVHNMPSRRVCGVVTTALCLLSTVNVVLTLEPRLRNNVSNYDLCLRPGSLFVMKSLSNSTVGCIESNFTCDSLQSALDFGIKLSLHDPSVENLTVCIEGSSTQLISSRMHFNNISLQLIGVDSIAVVCSYYSQLESDVISGTDYTWYFNNSQTVLIDNIHFQQCPYPIRAVAIQSFVVENSSFR